MHLEAISLRLADLAFGQRCPRLIVEAPPRHGKSILISHWFVVWSLLLWPKKRILLASYEADFASHWGRMVRNTIERIGGDYGVKVSADSAAAGRWDTTAGGGMFTAGIGGPFTGRGGDILVVDDPVKNAEEADSEAIRRRNWEWWQYTARTRLEPGGIAVLTQTRWREDDLAGKILADVDAGGEPWELLKMPAVAELDDPLGRKPGEALWPARFNVEALAEIKRAVGARAWGALYQQSPSPDTGAVYKREWFASARRWREVPNDLTQIITSWDMSFVDTDGSDYVVGQVWGLRGAERFLLDQVRDRMSFTTTKSAFRALHGKWPKATAKLVENKANGPAIISELSREVLGIIPVEPSGSKRARAESTSPQFEAGNVVLPDPSVAPWIHDWIEEHCGFPHGAHDDQVDAQSQALRYLASKPAPRIRSL